MSPRTCTHCGELLTRCEADCCSVRLQPDALIQPDAMPNQTHRDGFVRNRPELVDRNSGIPMRTTAFTQGFRPTGGSTAEIAALGVGAVAGLGATLEL
jgi:hypothetical protein